MRLNARPEQGWQFTWGYDANGQLTQRGEKSFIFDIGNRMWWAPGKVVRRTYDGHGRRGIEWQTDGS